MGKGAPGSSNKRSNQHHRGQQHKRNDRERSVLKTGLTHNDAVAAKNRPTRPGTTPGRAPPTFVHCLVPRRSDSVVVKGLRAMMLLFSVRVRVPARCASSWPVCVASKSLAQPV